MMFFFFFLLKERLTLLWCWFSGYFSKVYISFFFFLFSWLWCFLSWILTSYKSQKRPLIHRVLSALRSGPKKHQGPCASVLQSPVMWGRVLLILCLQLISHISPQTPSLLPWTECPPLPIRGIPCNACFCGGCPCDASGRPLSLAFDLLLTTSGLSVELGCEGICELKTMVSPLWDSPGLSRKERITSKYTLPSQWDWSSWAGQAGPEGLGLSSVLHTCHPQGKGSSLKTHGCGICWALAGISEHHCAHQNYSTEAVS